MSNSRVIKHFGVADPFLGNISESEELCEKEKYSKIKYFFTHFRNPIGIEVEVENYQLEKSKQFDFWGCKNDGSLKIKGVEFVSAPLSGRQIDCALHELQTHFARQDDLLWSHRTSIHIHLNVSTITVNQLKALVALYALFENLYFSFVNSTRKANPYCYPVINTDPIVFNSVYSETKYCALNLAPIKQFGTIEFRHLQGTQDFKLIRRWIQLIVKLHRYVENSESSEVVAKVKQILMDENYLSVFKDIYGASSVLFLEEDVLKSAAIGQPWAALYLEQPIEG